MPVCVHACAHMFVRFSPTTSLWRHLFSPHVSISEVVVSWLYMCVYVHVHGHGCVHGFVLV